MSVAWTTITMNIFSSWGKTRLLLAVAASILLVAGVILLRSRFSLSGKHQQGVSGDYAAQMLQLEKQGRFEEAVQTGLKALRNTPRDAVAHEQIAIAYLMRAGKDSKQRERWTEEAATYIDKALLADPDDPIIIFNEGRNFEIAGDLSTGKRCAYYQRSLALVQRLAQVLDSNHITIGDEKYSVDPVRKDFTSDGHTFRLKPLQKESESMSKRVKTKTGDAKCKEEKSSDPPNPRAN